MLTFYGNTYIYSTDSPFTVLDWKIWIKFDCQTLIDRQAFMINKKLRYICSWGNCHRMERFDRNMQFGISYNSCTTACANRNWWDLWSGGDMTNDNYQRCNCPLLMVITGWKNWDMEIGKLLGYEFCPYGWVNSWREELWVINHTLTRHTKNLTIL